jgi:hypothetical protein
MERSNFLERSIAEIYGAAYKPHGLIRLHITPSSAQNSKHIYLVEVTGFGPVPSTVLSFALKSIRASHSPHDEYVSMREQIYQRIRKAAYRLFQANHGPKPGYEINVLVSAGYEIRLISSEFITGPSWEEVRPIEDIADWTGKAVEAYIKMWNILERKRFIFNPDSSNLMVRAREGNPFPVDLDGIGDLDDLLHMLKYRYLNFPTLILDLLNNYYGQSGKENVHRAMFDAIVRVLERPVGLWFLQLALEGIVLLDSNLRRKSQDSSYGKLINHLKIYLSEYDESDFTSPPPPSIFRRVLRTISSGSKQYLKRAA